MAKCYKCKKDALPKSNYCEDHQPNSNKERQKKSLVVKENGLEFQANHSDDE